MDLVKSKPELASQLSKARFVFIPSEVEVLGAILPSLEHSPPPSVCGQVAVNLESSSAVRVDVIHATGGDADFYQVRAVLKSCEWKDT